jgi:type IX secretion system PorP/SprF family membrane protein
MKKYIITSGFIITNLVAYTQQDVHYSQFYSLPSAVNPATAGIFDGSFRATLDYRQQWTSITTPWKTMAAAADFKFAEDDLTGNFFNGAVLVYNDNAGDSKFKTGLYNLTFGYTVHISHGAYFTAALQGGLIQNSINYSDLYFESQYNGYKFDESRPTLENQDGTVSFTKGDLSLGVNYFNALDDSKTIFFGAAGNHLLAHKVSFTGINDHIFRKVTIHGGAQFIIGKAGIIPNFMASFQGPNMVVNLGSDLKIFVKEQSSYTGFINEMSYGGGVYYRFGDAVLLAGKFNISGFSLSAGYDINVSGLKSASNGKGAFEMLVGWRANFGIGKGKTTKFL